MLPDRPAWKTWRSTLDFILDHPRRVSKVNFAFRDLLSDHNQVYTNLFPARHTWYLLATVVIFNGIDWAGFEVLSIGNKEIEGLPTAYRIMDGLFQALGTKKPSA
jgi:hypothetical protein